MKHIEVQIMGQSYVLGCPEDGEERLHKVVERVDSAMCKIRDNSKIRARDRIAVLAALNLAFDLTDPAAAAHPAAGPAAAPASAAMPAIDAATDAAKLQALLLRLDDALSRDNRLL